MTHTRWNIWVGPEVEGSHHGEQRVFVHELKPETQPGDIVAVARGHKITTVYFCAEHYERHGASYISAMPEDLVVVPGVDAGAVVADVEDDLRCPVLRCPDLPMDL